MAIICLGLFSCETLTPPIGTETLDCSDIDATVSLIHNPDLLVDYLINCDLVIETSLVIEAGTIIEMGPGASIRIGENATIKVLGTVDQPVVIRGSQAATTYWDGLRIDSKLTGNELNHLHISDGGSGWNFTAPAMIWARGSGEISIRNCRLNRGEIGVLLGGDMVLNEFSGNSLTNLERTPISGCIQHLGTISNTNSFTDNQVERIELYACQQLTRDQVWEFASLPVEVTQQVTVAENTTLTIREGVTLLMNDFFKVKGSLFVDGTATNPVIFNGQVEDSPGYWSVLSFDTFADNSRVDHAIISGAGQFEPSIGFRGSINILNGSVSITNTLISNGTSCGINVRTSTGTLTQSNNTFFNLEGDDICLN